VNTTNEMNSVPEDPLRERLERTHENFAAEAHAKESRAEELEQEAARLRAEACGLRTAQKGVSEAIRDFVAAQENNAKRFADRGDDQPEVRYDARAHANRHP